MPSTSLSVLHLSFVLLSPDQEWMAMIGQQKQMDMLKIVATEEEAKQFSIDQVVLPVPGLESVYPENQLKQEYEAIFASDGIEITPALSKSVLLSFSTTNLVSVLSLVLMNWCLTGSSTCEELTVATWCAPWILSTRSCRRKTMTLRLAGNVLRCPLPQVPFPSPFLLISNRSHLQRWPTDEAATLKSERALEVAFNLPSSSYATVAIRELSKRNQ